MTLVVDRGARASEPRGSQPSKPRWRRIWNAPLWAHAAALAIVLVALMPLVGTSASFSADEGAAIIQARNLARGDGWIVDHPLPQVDPGGKAYPLELSEQGSHGSAPFAKHPLYALLLAGADRVAGINGMIALSLAGTVAAAALAAALARRLASGSGSGLARSTLWAVGIGSPLLFDGYLAIAHTLGAACAAAAVLCALGAIQASGSRRRRIVAAAGMIVFVALAVLLRNEAVFLALGLGVALAVVAWRRRSKIAAIVAAASVATAAFVHVVEAMWAHHIVGGGAVTAGSVGSVTSSGGFLDGRVHSLALTWVYPNYGGNRRLQLALVVMIGALALAVIAARRHPNERGPVLMLAGAASIAAVAGLYMTPTNLAPGLLVACPVAAAGIVALAVSNLESEAGRVALVTFAVFAVCVAITEYSTGGSGEWGGRYFAIGLPLLLPVAIAALAKIGAPLDRGTKRVGAAALVVCSLAMATMGLLSIRDTHQFTTRLVAAVDAAGKQTGNARPVVVATRGAVPRLAWLTFDRQRWLLSTPTDLGSLLPNLRAAGIQKVVLVSDELKRDLTAAGGGVQVTSRAGRTDGRDWQVAVLTLNP